MSHEELLTSVVGSHAHPGWFVAGIAAAERGEFGPADLAEMLDDAVDLAIRDQEEAGIDVISDGEMRRAGFFTAEFYRHVSGVRALPSERRLGAGGHDQQHRFEVLEPIAAPNGLGVVEEFVAARSRTTRPLKVTLPGPYTLSGRLRTGPGQVYGTRVAAAEAFVPILQAELRGLADAGATILQVDEPSPAIHPDAPTDFAALFNAAIEPVRGGCGSGPISASATTSVDRSRPARIGRSATRCLDSGSTSSSSSLRTGRWPRSACCPSWSMPAATSRPV